MTESWEGGGTELRAEVSLESEEGKESVGAMEGGRKLERRRGSWAQAGQRRGRLENGGVGQSVGGAGNGRSTLDAFLRASSQTRPVSRDRVAD